MPPLSTDRNTPRRDGEFNSRDVAASTEIFAGSLVVLDASGNAAPGSAATGLVADGRAEEHVDNSSGSAGDKQVTVRKGVFRFANSAGADEITKAHIGDDCYIVDDETVEIADDTGSRSVAGTVVDVDAAGVWVRFD